MLGVFSDYEASASIVHVSFVKLGVLKFIRAANISATGPYVEVGQSSEDFIFNNVL